MPCRHTIFDSMPFSTINYNKMVGFAYMFARKKSYKHMTKAFRALLGRAHKDKDVMFNLAQIGAFCFSDYNPDRYDVSERHPDVLSDEQLRAFLNLNVEYITHHTRTEKKWNYIMFMRAGVWIYIPLQKVVYKFSSGI
ncbi:MAG TPA: hypothetical protein IAC34_02420 [Candidatus Coprenecus stercoripullorum]|nr:hypothetical protein [Candidatus Coprenecus stercoripullorum]